MIITNAWIRTLVHDNDLEVYVIMKFFIDTANVDYIKEANDMGIICGVTTNPSLIAKEGRVFEEVIAEIASIVDGPISGEVKATTTDAETMIKEGIAISKIHPNMVVKIPMTAEGLKATKALSAMGIKTNLYSQQHRHFLQQEQVQHMFLHSLEDLMIFLHQVWI